MIVHCTLHQLHPVIYVETLDASFQFFVDNIPDQLNCLKMKNTTQHTFYNTIIESNDGIRSQQNKFSRI